MLNAVKQKFTAVIKQDSGWWIGWIEEIPGVNSQGKTKAELMRHLRSALREALEFNQSFPCPEDLQRLGSR